MAYHAKGVDPANIPALAAIEQTTGVSHFYRTMAHSTQAMENFYKLYTGLMGPGTLSPRVKEMLYLAVSFVNECDYCSGHHRRSAAVSGLTQQEIHEIETEQGQNFSPGEQAALHYARELTRTSSVDDDVRYRVQEYFSTDQMVEMTMIIGLANFTNRFNEGLDIPLEDDVLSKPY